MRKALKGKRYTIFLLIGALILCLGIVCLTKCKYSEMQPIMYVNGEPVTIREFKQRMEYDYRAVTIDYFARNWNAQVDEEFWGKRFRDITPREYLAERTIENCALIKIQTLKMKEMGIINDISYQSFLSDLEVENQRRKETVQKGGIIYGPEQYSENEYFEYVFSNLRKELKEKMATELGWNEESELQEYYETFKDSYYKYSDDIEIIKLVVPYNNDSKSETYSKLEKIVKASVDKESFEKAANVLGEIEVQNFTEETARSDSRYFEPLKLAAMSLEPDSVSQVIDDGENLSVIYCVSKIDGGYIPFDSIRDNVRQQYYDQCFDEWLNNQYAKAEIVVKNVERIVREVE